MVDPETSDTILEPRQMERNRGLLFARHKLVEVTFTRYPGVTPPLGIR